MMGAKPFGIPKRAALVLDLDIKGFFGSIDHGLLLKALRKHAQTPWALLYVERC